jgi:hypothetical protein
MHWNAMEWWPTLVMAGVYIAAWGGIVWIAARALTDRQRRGPR